MYLHTFFLCRKFPKTYRKNLEFFIVFMHIVKYTLIKKNYFLGCTTNLLF